MTKHDAYGAIGFGLGEIQLERVRQVKIHGWTPETDLKYTNNELLRYASYWMTLPHQEDLRFDIKHDLQQSAKLTGGDWADEWFKYDERTPLERLARAGALVSAEIDRQRLAAK